MGKNLLSEIKLPVISSIIATILFIYFLEPVLSFLGRFSLKIGILLFSSFIDRLYAEIAVGSTDIGFFVLFFLLLSLGLLVTIKSYPGLSPFTTDTTDSKKPDKVDKTLKFIFVLLPWILFISVTTINYIKSKSITSFNQHINILTPYISSQEKDYLTSQFHSMNSYSDYQKYCISLMR